MFGYSIWSFVSTTFFLHCNHCFIRGTHTFGIGFRFQVVEGLWTRWRFHVGEGLWTRWRFHVGEGLWTLWRLHVGEGLWTLWRFHVGEGFWHANEVTIVIAFLFSFHSRSRLQQT